MTDKVKGVLERLKQSILETVEQSKSALRPLRPSERTFTARNISILLASILIPMMIEYAPHFLEFGPKSHSIWRSPVFLYQWLVTQGPRKPRSHFVRLVILRRTAAPDAALDEINVCPGRRFTAKLLDAVERANPAMIVIDKRFAASPVCADGETGDLVSTVERIARSVPVIIGYWDKSAAEAANQDHELNEKLKREDAVVLFPTLDLKGATQGLLQLDFDNRRIPLDWPAYNSEDEIPKGKPRRLPSLAVTAAQIYDPGALEQPRIRKLRTIPDFPFTSFLTETELGIVAPLQLICAEKAEDWQHCPPAPPNPTLRNRIVVIGQDFSYDFHESAIGRVPGVVLQANYIESILDDRYLHPVPWWVQLALSVIWVAVIELLFDKLSLGWATLVSSAITVVAGMALYTICVVHLGIYLVLLPPSILVIALKVIDRFLHPHNGSTAAGLQGNRATEESDLSHSKDAGRAPVTTT